MLRSRGLNGLRGIEPIGFNLWPERVDIVPVSAQPGAVLRYQSAIGAFDELDKLFGGIHIAKSRGVDSVIASSSLLWGESRTCLGDVVIESMLPQGLGDVLRKTAPGGSHFGLLGK